MNIYLRQFSTTKWIISRKTGHSVVFGINIASIKVDRLSRYKKDERFGAVT